jgi:Na+-transporting methylmalonyl-CoA/oxaloacetate decarboxylase gamma subunit
MLQFYAARVADTYSTQDVLVYALLGIAVVMTILALLAGAIVLISKLTGKSEAKAAEKPLPPLPVAQAEAGEKPAAPKGKALGEAESQGQLTLVETDAATAAILMAIVSERSGIPLNHLEFKRIRLLRE